MTGYRFTKRAEEDLQEIAEYTLRRWGEKQCERYLDDLEECCERLAANPDLGRPCDYLSAGYRRAEHARHVLFFRVTETGILVVRILHVSMVPGRHLDADDTDE